MKLVMKYGHLMLAATIACQGVVDGGKAHNGADDDGIGNHGSGSDELLPDPAKVCNGKINPGESPIRRLNRFEYNNTVRDLLGDTSNPANGFPPEEIGNGFSNDAAALGVSRLLSEQYLLAAQGLAKRATSDAAKLNTLVGCDVAKTGEEACAKMFIESFGTRAFRRPLDDGEKQRLFAVYTAARAGADFKAGVETTVTAMLQMPQFLYRVEMGTAVAGNPAIAKLGPYEMASRLSYMLWSTAPDQALMDAAKAGRLGTKAEVEAQVDRMLNDPKAHQITRYFYEMLFGLVGLDRLHRNTQVFPTYVPELGPLFKQELDQFIDYVLWQGDGKLGTLLTADFTFMNARLAQFYGIASPPSGASFEKVTITNGKRVGLMTSAGVMASLSPGTQSNPVVRGVYLRRKLLCESPPDPPPALMVAEPKPDLTLTTRERFSAHLIDGSCKGCHALLDPLGFAFENYDGVGLWRDKDNNKPVDASGNIEGTDTPGPFNGAPELMARLAKSGQVAACHADQWLTFAYGRALADEDVCTEAQVKESFVRSGGRVRDLLAALATTDAFFYRKAVTP